LEQADMTMCISAFQVLQFYLNNVML